MQNSTQQDIDKRIQQAQRKGVGIYLLSGVITLLIIIGFALWLFFIKGFSVVIGPTEALPSVKVELVSGIAWVSDTQIYTLGGEIVFEVVANTFETAQYAINSQSPSTIEIMLLPSPAMINAKVYVAGALADASNATSNSLELSQWYLNGTLIHVGESLQHQTPPGEYQLEVNNVYYRGESQKLSLKRSQQVLLTYELSMLQGTININSQPQGVSVSVNGQDKGSTPLVVSVSGGEYAVELSSDDYQNVTDNVQVQASFLHPTRNYQLAAKQGVLNISATPKDGIMLINNVEYSLGRIQLPANRSHKIHYQKPGYASYVKTITPDKNQETNIEISLAPLYGNITITTNVLAQISLNGKPIGSTLKDQRLLAVEHMLTLSAQGYRTITQRFTPRANKTTLINITLLTEFEARRQEGKPLFVNELGINMLRFKADAFTLGSPPNETGRRRNEHQLEVDFSRQFWVSEKEITQAQFSAFLNTNQRSQSKLPVTGVSWLEAAQYCNYLSQQEGLPVFYQFQNGRYVGVNAQSLGYRLPSEAEWEWLAKKAKRAASTTYVWGNQETLRDNLGNFADKSRNGKQNVYFNEYQDGHSGLAEVGSFKADRAGLFDLDGNVSEWVHDYYTNSIPDTSVQYSDYLGASNGDAWVIKGGNFETGRLRELRAAFREFSTTGKPTVGFRIARYHN